MSCYCNGTARVKNRDVIDIMEGLIKNSDLANYQTRIIVEKEDKEYTKIIVSCYGGDDAGAIYDFYTVCLADKEIYGTAVWEVDAMAESEARRYMEDEIADGYVIVI